MISGLAWRRPQRLVAVALVVALAVLSVACSDEEADSADGGPQGGGDLVTLVMDLPDATPDQVEAAAEVAQARLVELDVVATSFGWDDTTVQLSVAPDDLDRVRSALAEPYDDDESAAIRAATGGADPVAWSIRD